MASAAKIAVNNHISCCCCCIIEAQIIYYRIVCGWYISKAIPSKIAKKYLKPRQTFASLTVVVLALYFLRCRCYQTFAGVVVASNPPATTTGMVFYQYFLRFLLLLLLLFFTYLLFQSDYHILINPKPPLTHPTSPRAYSIFTWSVTLVFLSVFPVIFITTHYIRRSLNISTRLLVYIGLDVCADTLPSHPSLLEPDDDDDYYDDVCTYNFDRLSLVCLHCLTENA